MRSSAQRRRLLLSLLPLLLAVSATTAEPKPDIPDPFGLGERLALIDHLRDQFSVKPPEGASYAELVVLYWQAKGEPAEELPVDDDSALAADRVRRLRSELLSRHGVNAPIDAGEDALRALLAQSRDRATVAVPIRAPTAGPEARASDLDGAIAFVRRLDDEVADLRRRIETGTAATDRLVDEMRAQQDGLTALEARARAAATARNAAVLAYNTETQKGDKADPMVAQAMEAATETADVAVSAYEAKREAWNKGVAKTAAWTKEAERLRTRLAETATSKGEAEARVLAMQQANPAAASSARDGAAAGSPLTETAIKQAVVLIVVRNRGTGSGFLVGSRGYLVTNAHVVGDGAAEMFALWDGSTGRTSQPLRAVKVDATADLALLQVVGADDLPSLPLADVYDLSRPMLAVGFPLATDLAQSLGTSPTDIVISRGSLTSVRRQAGVPQWLQHDCSIASGSSGGPLIDQQSGAVIGVNTMVVVPRDGGTAGDGVNLAVPASRVRALFAAFIGK